MLKTRLFLFFGLFLTFLTFWKGNGGNRDVKEYLDDAERLWLKGDMSLEKDSVSLEEERELLFQPDITPKERAEIEKNIEAMQRPQYNRYAVGLAVFSGPLVLLGATLEKITPGLVGPRGMGALTVPILAALTCLLIFELGMVLKLPAPVSYWAAIVFAFGSTLFSFMRLYFTEVAVTFCIVLALWGFLKSRDREGAVKLDEPLAYARGSDFWWLLLSGCGLAGIPACHYGDVWIAVILWLSMAGTIVFDSGKTQKFLRLSALTLMPALTALALIWLHRVRYGAIGPGGYADDVSFLQAEFIPRNLRYLFWLSGRNEANPYLGWFWRMPWLLAALGFGMRSFKTERGLAIGLPVAFVAQMVFWMSYELLGYSPERYLQPLTGLFVLGLLFLGDAIYRRWPKHGLADAATMLIAWNLLFSLRGHDRPSTAPFLSNANQWLCYVWYMQPFSLGLKDGDGTPIWAWQWSVGLILLLGGLGLLF